MDGLDKLPADAAVNSLEAVGGAGRLSEAGGRGAAREAVSARAEGGQRGGAHGARHAEVAGRRGLHLCADGLGPSEQVVKASVDAFLKAVGTRASAPANPTAVAAPAKALVDEAVQATARDVLPIRWWRGWSRPGAG